MEQWIADVIGKMHINKISQTRLAKELNVGKDYIWMILNGKKSPKGIQKRIESAVNSIISFGK